MFERADAAWVLYKLDRGVEHILVDEAQDTSRAQWKILAKLAEDFLSGAGRRAGGAPSSPSATRSSRSSRSRARSRICSTPCAASSPAATRQAELAFADVRLTHSFRSAPAVLEAVDKVFAVAEVWKGVSAGDPAPETHSPIRDSLAGVVEIWPPVVAEEAQEPGDWTAPLDAEKRTHPADAARRAHRRRDRAMDRARLARARRRPRERASCGRSGPATC